MQSFLWATTPMLSLVAVALSFNTGVLLGIGFWIVGARKQYSSYSWKMLQFALSLFFLCVALLVGDLIRGSYPDNTLFLIADAMLSLGVLLLAVLGFFMPSLLAFRENRKMFWYIFPINFLFGAGHAFWLAMLFSVVAPSTFWEKLDRFVGARRESKTSSSD